jgi:hypothetical protein
MYNYTGIKKESLDRGCRDITDVIAPQTDGKGVNDDGGFQSTNKGR